MTTPIDGLFVGGPLDGQRIQAETKYFTATVPDSFKLVEYHKQYYRKCHRKYDANGHYEWYEWVLC